MSKQISRKCSKRNLNRGSRSALGSPANFANKSFQLVIDLHVVSIRNKINDMMCSRL